MSFGFSAGDFIQAIKFCKGVYEAVKDGPDKYKELKGELRSIQYTFQSLSHDAEDPASLLNRRGSPRKAELIDVVAKCERTMQEVQRLVDSHNSLEGVCKRRARSLTFISN